MIEASYNLVNPSTLLAPGLLEGQPISLDPTSLSLVPNTQNQLFIGAVTDDTVALAVKRHSGEAGLVAVKVVEDVNMQPPRSLRREVKVLATLDHPNILALLNAYLLPPPSLPNSARFLLFTPYYPFTLRTLLSCPTFIPSALAQDDPFTLVATSITYQLLLAVSYLHSPGVNVSHRDINPNNVVLARDGRVVLIDFGLALPLSIRNEEVEWDGETRDGGLVFEVGTGPYRPPELLFGSRSYSPKAVDLWMTGTTLAELFVGLSTPSPGSSAASSEGSDQSMGDGGGDEWDDLERSLSGAADHGSNAGQRWRRLGSEGELPQEEMARRKPLFDDRGGGSDLALIGSIFKVLGTPTVNEWPEAAHLPDFGRVNFYPFPPSSLASHLPYLTPEVSPSSPAAVETSLAASPSPILDILTGLLRYSADARKTADTAVQDARWWAGGQGSLLLPDGVEGGTEEGSSSLQVILGSFLHDP